MRLLLAVVCLSLSVSVGCSARMKGSDVPSASEANDVSAQAHAAVAAGALLLDVRSPEEFAEGHLKGAVNIPVDELPQRMEELGPPEREVVVYCRTGARSSRAAELLKANGHERVILLGPMTAW